MVRQDKITFLVSTLESPELYRSLCINEPVHDNAFNVSIYIDRILKRIGVISKKEINSSQVLTQYMPVNKHAFLQQSLNRFASDYCLEDDPECQNCHINLGCDYFNKKNDWLQ